MNLKEKLALLDRQTRPRSFELPKRELRNIRNLPEGEELTRPEGRFYRVRREYSLSSERGNQALYHLLNRSFESARFILKQPEGIPIHSENLLFLDAETTGLSSGVGTVAFLIGLGYFQKDSFILEQLFARDFREERAALAYLSELTQDFTTLVSFNGKTFDWPLLVNRWIFNRLPVPDHLDFHLDLLYLSRRLWRRTIGACTLGNIEKEILQITRYGDVPGYLVPQFYFDFLRTKDGTALQKVFYHNQMDILSLAALLNLQLEVLEGHSPEVPIDHLSLGKLFLQIKEEALSLEYLEINHDKIIRSEFVAEINLFLAQLYKRRQEWKKANNLWKTMMMTARFELEPYEELAKYYEHQARDCEEAHKICLEAQKRISLLEQLGKHPVSIVQKQALTHRIDRLARKIRTKRNLKR
ncbi:hypothetical protein BMS3Bbin03_00690 [bacterium BMS3Bbin03]|nr:hypothetical protein BMS3Bbin03_00690 [bacterium BMS3Bbin03]